MAEAPAFAPEPGPTRSLPAPKPNLPLILGVTGGSVALLLIVVPLVIRYRTFRLRNKWSEKSEYVFPGDRDHVSKHDSIPADHGSHIYIAKEVVGGGSVTADNEQKNAVEHSDMNEAVGRGNESSAVSIAVRRREPVALKIRKEIDVNAYINKVLRVLLTVFAVLTVVLSVLLDNSFNDRPLRFIPFGTLAPFTIFFGFLALGWFPRIPLRFIALLKRHGFLQHVRPCSPWHDNVLTDYSGRICTLKSMAQVDGTLQRQYELPQNLLNFLQLICPQVVITQEASSLDPHSCGQDSSVDDLEIPSGIIEHSSDPPTGIRIPSLVVTPSKVASSNINPVPSARVEETVVQIYPSPELMCQVEETDSGGLMLTLEGPTINNFLLEIHIFGGTPIRTRDTFELCCTFKDKTTERMCLNTPRIENLFQNLCRWMENPHPIVVEESSAVLHCMAIQDILWEFTKDVYTLESVFVQHRFVGAVTIGLKHFLAVICVLAVSLTGVIPLISEKRSLFFLFLLVPTVLHVLIPERGRQFLCHIIKSLLCPLVIKVRGFKKLYKSKSFFIWCNEFRKQRVDNPEYFLISQDFVNKLGVGERCFEVSGRVLSPDTPTVHDIILVPNPAPSGQLQILVPADSRTVHPVLSSVPSDATPVCDPQSSGSPNSPPIVTPGSPTLTPGSPTAQPQSLVARDIPRLSKSFSLTCKDHHSCKLMVIFDSIDETCYTNVLLKFYENDYLLDDKYFYGFIGIDRLELVEQVFNCYSDIPANGGYVESICPIFRSIYLAHCPRFLEICSVIITSPIIPMLLVAKRRQGCKLIIGDAVISTRS